MLAQHRGDGWGDRVSTLRVTRILQPMGQQHSSMDRNRMRSMDRNRMRSMDPGLGLDPHRSRRRGTRTAMELEGLAFCEQRQEIQVLLLAGKDRGLDQRHERISRLRNGDAPPHALER